MGQRARVLGLGHRPPPGEYRHTRHPLSTVSSHHTSHAWHTPPRALARHSPPGPLGLAPSLFGRTAAAFPRTPKPLTTREYPLPPQGGIQIFVRSYAPFATFGGGYRGDNRIASTDTRASARIRWVFTFDVAGMRQVKDAELKPNPSSNLSHGEGAFPRVMAYTALLSAKFEHDGTITGQAIPNGSQMVESVGRPGQGFSLVGTLAGANPLVGVAPDIDVQVNLTVKRRDRRLEFSGSLMGDAFPNAEVFVRDAAGDTVMLHTFATAGDSESGPMVYLPGDNRRPMGTFARSVLVNPIGLLDE
jgi:hypothetical protein